LYYCNISIYHPSYICGMNLLLIETPINDIINPNIKTINTISMDFQAFILQEMAIPIIKRIRPQRINISTLERIIYRRFELSAIIFPDATRPLKPW